LPADFWSSKGNERKVSDDGLRLARKTAQGRLADTSTPGMSPSDIASHNGRLALEILRRHGPQTRLELAGHLGLTEPAIAGIMARLKDAGLVDQRTRQTRARYVSREYTIIADGAFAIGIDLGTAGGTVVLLDLSMTVVDRRDLTSVNEAQDAVKSLLSHEFVAARCHGVGLSLTRGVTPSPLSWPGLKVIDEIEAAVVAECVLGRGNRQGGLVVLLIEDTVRAGLLIGGQIFRGEHGRAGEIGAMATGPDRVALQDVLNIDKFRQSITKCADNDEASLHGWARAAALHLKDAIIAIGGFLSPDLILLAGNLPQIALQQLADQVNAETRAFITSFAVPDVAVATYPQGGRALGAAASVFVGQLLPELSQMPPMPAEPRSHLAPTRTG
jgi:predicted NBD/HSP70 family sugar kinase